MKTEPSVYSIDDLYNNKTGPWEGVRNYQARNFMRDKMQIGDAILFYHSNSTPSGVVGVARVCRAGYPDHFSWDNKSKYYDPKSSEAKPLWFMVDVEFIEKFPSIVPLERLKSDPSLSEMLVVQKGSRLSVQPVEKKHFDHVCQMGRKSRSR
jgi:predicted RNA-binding protein with PUA-like domain